MKKIVLSIIVLLTTIISSFAQIGTSVKSGSHLQFEGITMNGKIKDFCSKLENKGYNYEIGTKYFAKLNGNFMGCKDCDVSVCGGMGLDVICSIVIQKATKSKKALLDNYFTLKGKLVEKYGTPSFCKEKSKCIIKSTNKIDNFIAEDKGIKYMTKFNLNDGSIFVTIQDEIVMISYIDNINYELTKKSCARNMH